ncbi:MAG: hypothetical protein ABJK25_11550 [Halieaceae bacterium]
MNVLVSNWYDFKMLRTNVRGTTLGNARGVLSLCLYLFFSPVAKGQDLVELTPEDIRESIIAFVNLYSTPGLDGATFRVNDDNRESDLIRGSLGYSGDLTIKGSVFDAYWGIALAYGSLEGEADVLSQRGRPLQLDVDRDILSLRGSGGLSLPITRHFKLRPFLSLSASHIDTNTSVRELGGDITLPEIWVDSEVDALTTTATLFADYDRWYEQQRLELRGQYSLAYTDTFNASNDNLDTWSWNETLFLRARYSAPTNRFTRNKPWRWNSYVSHTRFLGLEQRALGFNSFSEVGVGLDFELNIRPLDWFGLRFIGIKAGYIFGDGVDGLSVGLNF